MPPLRSSSALPQNLLGALVHPWTWRMAWRDSRMQRKRLVLFSLSVVAGISALVAIHSLKASAQTAIETQARALLGSDLQISSHRPLPGEAVKSIGAQARQASRETAFSSMLYFPGADSVRLVQIRGIESGYPFYGTIETSPPEAWRRLQSEAGILLEPALLTQFAAKVGDRVKLGTMELTILGTVVKAPPRSGRFGSMVPEAYVRLEDLERTGLLGASSLATYFLNLELSKPEDAGRIKAQFADAGWRFETPKDRRETLGKVLDNFQQYLGILAIAALVLGAIGVAGALHAHIDRRIPAIAILRGLGCPGDLAFAVYFVQAGLLALAGGLAGGLLGVALQTGLIRIFHSSFPIEIDGSPRWLVAVETATTGLAVCVGFAMLPLLRVRRVSPSAILRGDAIPAMTLRDSLRAWPFYLLAMGCLAALSFFDTSHALRGLGLTGGVCAAFAILTVLAKGLVVIARKTVSPGWPYFLRQGVSNLHRPQNQTLLFLLSLGLGTFLLLTILMTKDLLLREFQVRGMRESPNIYLVDVQQDQLEGVIGIVQGQHLPVLETAPIVTMRIQSVRGTPVGELEKQHAIPKWVLQREFRSSYRDHLNTTEKIVAGAWQTRAGPADAPVPLSLEEGIAKDLHVGVGDELVLDVQGMQIKARVANLRKVDWSRFNLNFFMIFPPGVLESAPGFQVVTTRVPSGTASGDLQRVLVHAFPNVSAIDLTLILQTVQSMIDKISRVVSILAFVTVIAGLPILAGTLMNGRDQRVRESVLLRTLGASAYQVRIILLVEYTSLGLLSAVAGVVLAAAANFALARYVFETASSPDLRILGAGSLIATLIAISAGLLLGRGISRHPPLEILRGMG